MFDGLHLIETQASIEAQALADGADKWLQKNKEAAEAGLAEEDWVVARTIGENIALVAAAIRAKTEELQGRTGPETLSKLVLAQMQPEKVAYAALLSSFNAAIRNQPLRESAITIASLLEVEILASKIDGDVAKRIGLLARRGRDAKTRLKGARKLLRDNQLEEPDAPWSRSEKTKLGGLLLDIILEVLPEFALYEDEDKVLRLTLTDEAAGWLSQQQHHEALMHPMTPCMIVPPTPWTGLTGGGYVSDKLRRLHPLARTQHREHRKLIEQHIEAGTMQRFLNGVNVAQAVAFTVNRQVLGVQLEFKRKGIALKKVPSPNDVMIPSVPDNYEELEPLEQKGWRLKRREARIRNIGLRGQRKVYESDLKEALRYSEFDRFWLPISVDFRGRMYPIPTFNYQRSDPVKSLFLFADGVQLGEHGWKWLLIHAANAGDFDKISKRSFGARFRWATENIEKIVATAWDPVGTLEWWGKADKPWQFLAACFEIAEARGSANTTEYVSHLPIALDGSNSGLQHYSALLRSYEDGAQVNLIPMQEPVDVYQTVANKVMAWVQRDAEAGLRDALLWRNFGITRSLVKRGVMTYPYGSEMFGMKKQIITDTMDPIGDELLERKISVHPFVDKETAKEAAGYLAKHIFNAVVQTVSRAQEGMTYLKKVAALLAHERKPVIWTTPAGFPVLHKYLVPNLNRVELLVSNKRVTITVADGYQSTINKTSARNAVSPNVIHSCDAAHVRRVVLAAKAEGINSYMLIHDSFATHAGNTERWSHIIREEMVALYEEWDPLQMIYDNAWAQLSEEGREKLPLPPQKGSLDLKLILQSDYAFA
jgi:DNA-directed RNA polymerase